MIDIYKHVIKTTILRAITFFTMYQCIVSLSFTNVFNVSFIKAIEYIVSLLFIVKKGGGGEELNYVFLGKNSTMYS